MMEFKLYKSKVAPTYLSNTQTVLSSYYILANDCGTLWFNRSNTELLYLPIKDFTDFELICTVYGYIGQFQIDSNSSAKIIFAKRIEEVCTLNLKSIEHRIYKIKQILVLPWDISEEEFQIELEISANMSNEQNTETPKSADLIKNLINKSTKVAEKVTTNKFEKKILEEIYKIFQENSGSFYMSPTFDLTNSIEHQHSQAYDASLPLWHRADSRYFWNWSLINNLISMKPECDNSFIIPIIQGFIQTEFVNIDLKFVNNKNTNEESTTTEQREEEEASHIEYKSLKLFLISRRSRFRLGTRFKKRGIDEDGNVANFVETEQIIEVFNGHVLSFVILRGSIPVYWSQPGFKYRPAPQIDKSYNENKTAFGKHFKQLEEHYPLQRRKILVNLVEEAGKEKLLADAYLELVKDFNEENLVYVQFDFHEHCKGLKFENVSRLTTRIEDMINEMNYCWVDRRGLICTQKQMFRVNCVDCLDRTNVVQMVISKHVLENQLRKLGLIGPDALLSHDLKRVFSILWANNGDAISHQYAGTGALKGDYTRTGERNFTGIMKDGVKSANRFYLRFKENYRQMAFDVLQGLHITEFVADDSVTSLNINNNNNNNTQSVTANLNPVESQAIREENIRQLVADCRKQLIGSTEDCYGSWALINCVDYDPIQTDPDIILLFTGHILYVSNYDDNIEQLVDYQRIPIENIEKIEIGPESSFLKSTRFDLLRIHYRIGDESGYFYSFKSSCFRFFNNLVITMKSIEEETESLRGIAQTIKYTASHFHHEIPLIEETKLARKKSKVPKDIISLSTKMSTVAYADDQSSSTSPAATATSTSPAAAQATTAMNRINSVGKLVGNKLLDFSRKMRIPSPIPPSLVNSPPKQQQQQLLKVPTSITTIPHSASSSSLNDANLINFEAEQSNSSTSNNLINFDDRSSVDDLLEFDAQQPVIETSNSPTPPPPQLPTSESQISITTAENTTTTPPKVKSSDDDVYSIFTPHLSRKQFTNKQQKINYLNEFTSDSSAHFLFI